MKGKGTGGLLKVGLILALFGVVTIASFLFFRRGGKSTPGNSDASGESVDISEKDTEEVGEGEEIYWDIYVNEEYGYSIAKPKLLAGRQYENVGEYLHFIRFGENKFSRGKGVAVGVSDMGLEKQAETIKSELADDRAVLVSERTLDVEGKSALILEYGNTGDGEDRTIAIIEEGEYTYSISTVPEQMDHVLANLRFF